MDAKTEREIKDRLRRIETRLTKFMEAQGFDTGTQQPEWHDGIVEVPTDGCSLRAIKDVVPADWPVSEEIEVRCKGKFLVSFYLDQHQAAA